MKTGITLTRKKMTVVGYGYHTKSENPDQANSGDKIWIALTSDVGGLGASELEFGLMRQNLVKKLPRFRP